MKPVFIYALNCPLTGQCRYIGKSCNPKGRLSQHISKARSETNHRACWVRSLLNKGLRPELEMLAQVPEAEWSRWEIDYIAAFRTLGHNLVNGTTGGDAAPTMLGKKYSPVARLKMKISKLGEKNPFFGKKHSAETLAKMSLTRSGERAPMFGKKHSAESRAKMSAARMGEKNPYFGKAGPRLGMKNSSESNEKRRQALLGEKNHFFGKKHSPESRAKISAARKKKYGKRKFN